MRSRQLDIDWILLLFVCVWTKMKSRSIDPQKKEQGHEYPTILTLNTSLVNRGYFTFYIFISSTAISLSNYSGRLKHLDVSSCHQITDNSLSALRLEYYLHSRDLHSIKQSWLTCSSLERELSFGMPDRNPLINCQTNCHLKMTVSNIPVWFLISCIFHKIGWIFASSIQKHFPILIILLILALLYRKLLSLAAVVFAAHFILKSFCEWEKDTNCGDFFFAWTIT